jgi:hypothetical protein
MNPMIALPTAWFDGRPGLVVRKNHAPCVHRAVITCEVLEVQDMEEAMLGAFDTCSGLLIFSDFSPVASLLPANVVQLNTTVFLMLLTHYSS